MMVYHNGALVAETPADPLAKSHHTGQIEGDAAAAAGSTGLTSHGSPSSSHGRVLHQTSVMGGVGYIPYREEDTTHLQWLAAGVVLGVVMMRLFSIIFEKRREQLLNRVSPRGMPSNLVKTPSLLDNLKSV